MKWICLCLVVGLMAFSHSATAAARRTSPSPAFIIDDPIVPPARPPQVDAVMFLNRSLFVYSNDFLFPPFTFVPAPYTAQSVRFWTNSGVMVGLPGFEFQYVPNPAHLTRAQRRRKGANLPQPSFVFQNDGQISVSDSLLIHAREIYNRGVILGDTVARVRIRGTNGLTDLSHGAIRIGDLPIASCVIPSNFFFGPFFFGIDPTVNYAYLSSGTSGSVGTNRFPLQLPSLVLSNNFNGFFMPPNPQPPFSEYIQAVATLPGAPATNLFTNFLTTLQSCGEYDAFVHLQTNQLIFNSNILGTVRNIRVAFVPTNGFATNVTAEVRFPTNVVGFFNNDSPIVEFRAVYYDVIEQRLATNFVTFRDDGGTIFRGRDCTFPLADPPNAPFTPDLFYTTQFQTNVVDYFYTVASATVGNTNSIYFTNAGSQFLFLPELGRSPAASDITNAPGTLTIDAQDLNLTQARLRAENAIFIRATNLVGNAQSFIDAPFVTFDVGSRNPTLVISNLVQDQISRVQAKFNSWSGSWSVSVTNGGITNIFVGPVVVTNANNEVVTNTVTITNIIPIIDQQNFQVLILGACVDALHPSILSRLNLRATNVVIEDNLAINQSILIQGRSLTIGSNASITMPRGANLAFTNIQNVTSFTNEGVINVQAGAFFGAFESGFTQPPPPRRIRPRQPQPLRLHTYTNVVNHSAIHGANVSIRANYVEHRGHFLSPATITATNGPVLVDGATLIISNASIVALSDVRLTAGNLLAARSILSAGSTNGGVLSNTFLPGAILLDITNNATDGGVSASNDWRVTTGVQFTRRPQPAEGELLGDLMGTRIAVRSGVFAQSIIQWAGEDRGADPGGFVNNLALGQLVLDGSLGNLFRFRGAGPNQALYVDYLELLNDATNFNFALGVAPDFTLYIGDSNIDPDKLQEGAAGRVVWVTSRTGPYSSTNLVYPDGNIYTFNAGVVRSKDRDDDGDGVNNAEDCTPIPVGDNPALYLGALCDAIPSAGPSAAFAKSLAVSTSDIGLTISLVDGEAVLSWSADAHTINTVEFTDSLESGSWRPLTNFTNGPDQTRVTVKDAAGAPLRVYRVRVDAPKR